MTGMIPRRTCPQESPPPTGHVGDNAGMRRSRVYHSATLRRGDTVTVTDTAANHLSRVLRLAPGDQFTIFSGDGVDYSARILAVTRDGVQVVVESALPSATESPLQVMLLQGVCRGQRMDLVIQKATELGVTAIHPIACERSVVRLDGQRATRRLEHWQGVAIAAAEQSGRSVIPAIDLPQTLSAALSGLPADCHRILLDPAGGQSMGSAIGESGPVALLVGPEGGLTETEQDIATRAGFASVRMGPRILRTETAPLSAIAIMQYLRGDLGA